MTSETSRPVISEMQVVTRAATTAAERLGLDERTLAAILGLPEASVSRMQSLDHLLEKCSRPYDAALMLIRLFRSLNAMMGGNEAIARSWLTSHDTALDVIPAEKIPTIDGLTEIVSHLEARLEIA